MLNEIRKLMSPDQNRWNFRWVILSLALVALSVPIYAFTLVSKSQTVDIPEAILSLGATALGALAGYLTHYTQRQESSGADGSTSTNNPLGNDQPPKQPGQPPTDPPDSPAGTPVSPPANPPAPPGP